MTYPPSLTVVPFPTQIRRRLNGKLVVEQTSGPPCEQECVMSIEHPPHDRQARREAFRNVEHAGNVVPLREDNSVRQTNDAPHQGDELLTALSPLLDEVDGLRGDDAPYQETDNIPVLLEENARLRKLAVKLSNLLGDLPEQGT
ncbi:hypothetical protein [Bradyrhizobium sp. URHC0002]